MRRPAVSRILAALVACLAAAPAAGCSTSGRSSTVESGSPGAGASTSAPSSSSPSRITLAFGGDVHFEEYVADLLKDPEHSLAALQPTLGAADFSMVNLETAITEGGERQGKTFTFRAPATALRALAAGGVDAVSLANNHAADFGASGLHDTLVAKATSPIPMVGVGRDTEEAYSPSYVEVKGVRVALLSALQLWEETATTFSAMHGIGVATSQNPAALERLRSATRDAAAKADLVVVMMHWGTEYETCADQAQITTARLLEQDGADVIVGGHAHRQQGGGWLGRSYVGYGMGNFVWWRAEEPEARSGVLTLTVDADAARARGTSTGEGRRTAEPLVREATWRPLLIDGRGIPQKPAAADAARLQGVWDAAVECSGLRSAAAARPAPA